MNFKRLTSVLRHLLAVLNMLLGLAQSLGLPFGLLLVFVRLAALLFDLVVLLLVQLLLLNLALLR